MLTRFLTAYANFATCLLTNKHAIGYNIRAVDFRENLEVRPFPRPDMPSTKAVDDLGIWDNTIVLCTPTTARK
jgi:hypothetical protein